MHLDSLSFVYFFLPLAMGAYYLTPLRFKKMTLVGITLVFYKFIEPAGLVLLFASAVYDYAFVQLGITLGEKPKGQRACILLSAGKTLGLLLYLGLTGALPVGLVVYSLNSLWYCFDLWKGEAQWEESFTDYFLFTAFFGCLYVGPLVRYKSFMPQLKELRPSLTSISRGIVLFIVGLAKKVILADNILAVFRQLHSLPPVELSVLSAWAMVASLALGVFFLLSSYSDMARGLGHIFSLEYPRNVYYPYQARTFGESLERMNISYYGFLTSLFPSPKKGEKSHWEPLRLLLLGGLMGLWFGLRTNYLIWGLLFGVLLLGERFVYGKILSYVPGIFKRAATFVSVTATFALFAGENLAQSLFYLRTLFGFAGSMADSSRALYLLSTNAVLILGGLLLCSSVFDLGGSYVRKKAPLVADGLGVLFHCALLFVTTAFLL